MYPPTSCPSSALCSSPERAVVIWPFEPVRPGTHYVNSISLKLTPILLLQAPTWWGYRRETLALLPALISTLVLF